MMYGRKQRCQSTPTHGKRKNFAMSGTDRRLYGGGAECSLRHSLCSNHERGGNVAHHQHNYHTIKILAVTMKYAPTWYNLFDHAKQRIYDIIYWYEAYLYAYICVNKPNVSNPPPPTFIVHRELP